MMAEQRGTRGDSKGACRELCAQSDAIWVSYGVSGALASFIENSSGTVIPRGDDGHLSPRVTRNHREVAVRLANPPH
jgi:hypothetical protein